MLQPIAQTTYQYKILTPPVAIDELQATLNELGGKGYSIASYNPARNYYVLQCVAPIDAVDVVLPLTEAERPLLQVLPPPAAAPIVPATTPGEKRKIEVIRIKDIDGPLKHHPDCLYIGRRHGANPDSDWRNQYEISNYNIYASGVGADKGGTRLEVVAKYLWNILKTPELLARLGELDGMKLVCYCAPSLCHGHILRYLASLDTRSLGMLTARVENSEEDGKVNPVDLLLTLPLWDGFDFKMELESAIDDHQRMIALVKEKNNRNKQFPNEQIKVPATIPACDLIDALYGNMPEWIIQPIKFSYGADSFDAGEMHRSGWTSAKVGLFVREAYPAFMKWCESTPTEPAKPTIMPIGYVRKHIAQHFAYKTNMIQQPPVAEQLPIIEDKEAEPITTPLVQAPLL